MNRTKSTSILSAFIALLCLLSACASSSESAARDQMTAHVGVYNPPPANLQRVRIGVPPFELQDKSQTAEMSTLAADQATSLLVNTERFDVVERAQLNQLLKEQGLEGIVTAGELAKPAQVRGVDYLLLGKVTNLRVKAEKASKGFGIGQIPIPGTGGLGLGVFDYKNKESTIKVDAGIDLRLVDPSTGSVAAANFSEYTRTDSINAMGIEVLGMSSTAEADLKIDADNKGKILRLAIDDCVRKMLPKVDRALVARAQANAPSAGKESPAAGQGAETHTPPAAGERFCSQCGKKNGAQGKFCASCGAKLDG